MKRWGLMLVLVAGSGAAFAAPVVIDQFNDGKKENALGGATGAWFDPEDKSIYCRAENDPAVFFGLAGQSLRLEFDIRSQRENTQRPTNYSVAFPVTVSNPAFNGYYSIFPPQNLERHSHLIFWAKGDAERGYPRSFKVEIKDGQTAAGYVVEGLTDRWRRFAIPLREFRGIRDWTNIKEFVIVFASEANRKDGAIYLDDIYFAESEEQNLSLPAEEMTITEPDRPLTVDGDLRDWPKKAWRDIADAPRVELGARGGRKDAAARFALSWDADNLYLAVQLTDNEIVNNEEGDALWKGDCLEVFLVPGGTDFTWGDPAVFQLGFAPTSAAGNPGRWAWFQRRAPKNEETRVVWSKDRRAVEIAMAWPFLKMTAGVNRDLGFTLAFHDADAKDGTPECKLNWSFGTTGTRRHRVGKLVLR
jgi:hypothetical protein